MTRYTLRHGNCLDVMRGMEAESIDALVTDPPYGLGFMGKDWDKGVPGDAFWVEALRVAKPGAHLLAFGGTRTFHRLACAIEDAGWELRDTIMWVYGSGFPKSHDVSKAIDREAGEGSLITAPATAEAEQWDGWGTALKPAWEPIIVARKPLMGTVAQNVLAHSTGGLNIDGCRVGTEVIQVNGYRSADGQTWGASGMLAANVEREPTTHNGRWPANLIHDGSDEVVWLFPDSDGQQGDLKGHVSQRQSPNGCFGVMPPANDHLRRGDSGTAARFFYCAKASKADRNEGLDGFEPQKQDTSRKDGNVGGDNPRNRGVHKRRNHHPTVKPTDLMRYLCRLVTPPDGVVLDLFMGSGSTGKAAILEGFRFEGIDITTEYVEIAKARLAWAERQWRNKNDDFVLLEDEKAKGLVSLFDWTGGGDGS